MPNAAASGTPRSSRGRKAKTIAAAALLLGVIGAAPAQAGTYEVTACDASPDGLTNQAWLASASAASVKFLERCPSGGTATDGLVAQHTVQAPGSTAAKGETAAFTFDASTGTSIVGLRASYDFRERAGSGWHTGLFDADGNQILGATEADDDSRDVHSDLATTTIDPTNKLTVKTWCHSVDACSTNSGVGDGLLSFFALHDATVLVEDTIRPIISGRSGGLWDTAWMSGGVRDINFDASDGSGIATATVALDGNVVRTVNRTGNFTRPKPYADGGTSWSTDVGALSDGSHTISLEARDAGGNISHPATHTIKVDNTAPATPGDPALADREDDRWYSTNEFASTYTVPAADAGSPYSGGSIATCRFEDATSTTPIPGSCTSTTVAGAALTDGHEVLEAPAGKDGIWRARLRIRDALHSSAYSAWSPAMHLDQTAPTVTASGQPAQSKVAEPVTVKLIAADALSGMTPVDGEPAGHGPRIEYELNGQRTTAAGDTATVAVNVDGKHTLRYRAIDLASAASAWKTITFEIDRTPPKVEQPAAAPAATPTPAPAPAPAPSAVVVPAPAPKALSPQLKLGKMKVAKDRRTVTIRGNASRRFTGKVTITVTYKVGRKTRKITKQATARKGKFSARLKLARKWRAAKVTVRYSGSKKFRAQQSARTLKAPRR